MFVNEEAPVERQSAWRQLAARQECCPATYIQRGSDSRELVPPRRHASFFMMASTTLRSPYSPFIFATKESESGSASETAVVARGAVNESGGDGTPRQGVWQSAVPPCAAA